MRLHDGTILMHAGAPYDPQKAHEYYMRTRKLHPRAPAATFTVTKANGQTVKLNAKQLAEQRAYAHHRVVQITNNLKKLKQELSKKMFEAKLKEQEAKRPPTAAQKAKAKQDAKAYRQSHKQELKNKARQSTAKKGATKPSAKTTSSAPKTKTVDDLKFTIHQAQQNLKAAVANAHALATAKKNG